MKTKAITAAALAASFSAGYYTAPKHIMPASINPATIRIHEDAQKALEACLSRNARAVSVGVEKVPSKAQAPK